MEPLLQKRVQRYGWDRAADFYEKFWQKQLEPAQSLLLKMADLKPGEKVLDIACGTGLITFRALEKIGTSGEIVATDLSDKMVNYCKEISTQKNYKNISFHRMDAEELQFEDNSFDVVLSGLGIMYFPDPLKSLQEMQRVLKPGGRGITATWGNRKNCGWAEIFPIVDKRVKSDVCPMFFQMGTSNILEETYKQAGFKNTFTEKISTILEYDSPDDSIGAAFIGGPVALAYSRFDENTRGEAHQEYLNSIKNFKNGNGYNIPGEFVVVRGEK